jgi:glycosyltransferase involved in cell wall biosynthesis
LSVDPLRRNLISVIVPVLNEAPCLQMLTEEILKAASSVVQQTEIILIDDGSTDTSWETIRKLAADYKEVRGIRLRRNFGKAAALTAGMRSARGDVILMMDADLQDDPAEIPEFLKRIEAGADVVNGWKVRRLDPWHKVYPSRVFNWLVGSLTGLELHDHNCGLKMFRAEVAEEIQIYGELHRFIPVLAHERGFRVTEVPVNHRSRQFGHSKYGIRRFSRGLLDLLTVAFLISFRRRPQHALGAVGLAFLSTGILGLTYLTLLWILMNVFGIISSVPIGGRPLLAYSIGATLLGGQILSLGLLAELMVACTGGSDHSFSVREETSAAAPQARI